MKRSLNISVFIIVQMFCFFISANILYDETVPEDIRVEISRLYKENGFEASFLIEMHGDSDILIISEEGYIKKLPLENATARDVFNVMETMIDYIPSKEESEQIDLFNEQEFLKLEKELLEEDSKEKPSKPYLAGSLKINENNEFFPWTRSNSRFNAAIFISSQERWAGGLRFSAALAFLKLGFEFKKGSEIVLGNNQSVQWEAYGIFLMFDIFRFYDFRFSSGFKVELYDTRGRLFEREFFIFSISHRINWFEMGAAFNVSPSNVELGLFGQKYRMDQWDFVLFAGFLF